MPPPSPYNLNRFVVIGGAVMIVTGFFATRGSKPFPDMEKAAPEPVASPASSVAVADSALESAAESGVDPSPGASASKQPCPPGVPNCE